MRAVRNITLALALAPVAAVPALAHEQWLEGRGRGHGNFHRLQEYDHRDYHRTERQHDLFHMYPHTRQEHKRFHKELKGDHKRLHRKQKYRSYHWRH